MDATVIGQPSLGEAGGTGLLPGGGFGTGHTRVQVAVIGFTHILSPNLLFDANAGFSRLGENVKGTDYGKNFGLGVLGIPGTNGPAPRQSGQPFFSISGYENFGNADTLSPEFRNDNVFTYVANVTWTLGLPSTYGKSYQYLDPRSSSAPTVASSATIPPRIRC